MKNNSHLIFQLAAVYIGTIVGAGLASGQEITQFFSIHGHKSFYGIFLCCIMYIFVSSIIIKLSVTLDLKSYNDLIITVSPNFLGEVVNFITSIFLICGTGIILAGSGSMISQYFHVSRLVGIALMCLLSCIVLFRNTKGLIEVNSLIVPSLLIVICTIFLLYIIFAMDNSNIKNLIAVPTITNIKSNWFLSALLYGSFNILGSSGVLVPISNESKNIKVLITGITFGAVALTLLASAINFLLLVNMPNTLKYEIPLLYISNRFGNPIQSLLLIVIWLEMFSTCVSDIYSVTKVMEQRFSINYNLGVLLSVLIAIPISQFGFVRLISFLYPAFGAISLLFLLKCTFFYYRNLSK